MTPDLRASYLARETAAHSGLLETRLVVLPRFQGIGIGTKLPELVAAQCGAYGMRLMFKTSQELQAPPYEGCRSLRNRSWLHWPHLVQWSCSVWHSGCVHLGSGSNCETVELVAIQGVKKR